MQFTVQTCKAACVNESSASGLTEFFGTGRKYLSIKGTGNIGCPLSYEVAWGLVLADDVESLAVVAGGDAKTRLLGLLPDDLRKVA